MVAAMITTCIHACKFIDYGVRFFWKSIVALAADDKGYVQKSFIHKHRGIQSPARSKHRKGYPDYTDG